MTHTAQKKATQAGWVEASEWDTVARLPAEELLALLDGDQLPQPLRAEVVDEVLRRGYPWALQLNAEDVRRARGRSTSPRRGWLVFIACAVALTVGLVWWALKPRPGELVGAPPAAVGSSAPALEVTRRIAALQGQGRDEQARALAEGCAVTIEAPAACLRVLAAMPHTDPDAARQYGQLVLEHDHDLIRQRVRWLAVNDFARDASLLVPPVHEVEAQAQLLAFIDRALELESLGRYGELLRESAACSLRTGQHGLVCRSFWTRAARFTGQAAFPVTEDTPRARAIYSLRVAIDAALQGEHLKAVDAAAACIATGELDAVDCRRISAEANARWWADLQRRSGEEEREERKKIPRVHDGF